MSALPVAETDEKTFMEKLTFVWSLFKGISILKRFRASRDCGGSTGAPKISVTNWRCIPISFAAHLHFWDMVKFKGFWLTISTQKTTATKKGFQKSSVKLIWRELWALLGIISPHWVSQCPWRQQKVGEKSPMLHLLHCREQKSPHLQSRNGPYESFPYYSLWELWKMFFWKTDFYSISQTSKCQDKCCFMPRVKTS